MNVIVVDDFKSDDVLFKKGDFLSIKDGYVVTPNGNWICDIDSSFYKEKFKLIKVTTEGVEKIVYKALVSAHIYIDDEGKKDVEILSQVDNDDCEMFEGIQYSLLDAIEIGNSDDYYFIAIVEAETVVYSGFDYTEYDVEHHVKEIKSLDDFKF